MLKQLVNLSFRKLKPKNTITKEFLIRCIDQSQKNTSEEYVSLDVIELKTLLFAKTGLSWVDIYTDDPHYKYGNTKLSLTKWWSTLLLWEENFETLVQMCNLNDSKVSLQKDSSDRYSLKIPIEVLGDKWVGLLRLNQNMSDTVKCLSRTIKNES